MSRFLRVFGRKGPLRSAPARRPPTAIAAQSLGAMLLWVGAGCGGQPDPRPDQTGNRPPSSLEDRAAATPATLPAPGVFATPGLADWAAAEGLERAADEAELRVALKTTLPAPPALDCLAREYAARFAADARDAGPGTLEAFAVHCGFWARPARTLAFTGKTIEALRDHLTRLDLEALDAPVGLGTARDPAGRITVALAIPEQALSLDPVARNPAGPVLKLVGRALRGGAVEVWRAAEGVEPAPVPTRVQPDGQFEADVPLAAGGPTRIEVVHPQRHFRRTLGSLTVGAPRAERYTPHAGGPLPPASTVRADLLAALNRRRAAARLKPLEAAPQFTTPIEDWMGRVATGTTAEPPVGLSDARGWPFAELRYGFAEGADAEQAVALFAATPTGEALVTAPKATHLAVGMRAFERGAGLDAVLVALTPLEQQVDGAAIDAALAGLNAQRKAAGLSALALDGDLSAVAKGAAAAALSGEIPWAAVGADVTQRIQKAGLSPGAFGVGGQSLLTPSAMSWADEEGARLPTAKVVGIGLVAGPLPGGGAPRHLLIFIVAEQGGGVPKG